MIGDSSPDRRPPCGACRHFICAILVTVNSGASAQTAGEDAPWLYLTLGPSVVRVVHREFTDSGRQLLRESGTLPGWRLDARATQGLWELSVQASHADGSLDYDGRTQAGAPLATTTDARISEAGMRLLRSIDSGRQIAIGAGIAHRRWDRSIQPVGRIAGLDERYTTWLASFESRFSIARSTAATLDLEFSLRRTLRPEVSVDFGGLYDNQSIALGRQTGMRLAAPASLALGGGSRLRLETWVEYWGFDRSASQPLLRDGRRVGTVFQPENDGRSVGASLMWELSF